MSFCYFRVYEKANKIEEAITLIQEEVDKKTNTPTHYLRLAQLLKSSNTKAAKENLAIALNYWQQTDEDYIPRQQALELAKDLDLAL